MMVSAVASLLALFAPAEVDELEALETALAAALERIGPAVVRIETVGGIRAIEVPEQFRDRQTVPERPREGDPDAPERRAPGEGEEEEPQEGRTPRFENEWQKMLALPGFKKAEGPTTGVVVSKEGHVVTSAWNFESNPNVISVTTADGTTHAARLLGIDRAAGLALVKFEPRQELFVPVFLDPEQVQVGAWAFALGRALTRRGVEVKYGIVSAKNRIEGNAIQTDAATSPGNYGGPLIDVEGRVYGIIVPLGARGEQANPNWYDSGIGFVAPVPDPRRLVERLGQEGTVLLPAFLGIQMDQDRTEKGARITEVLADQPAARAGLAKDDIILALDDVEIENAFTLRFEVGRRRAGDRARLLVQRGDERLTLEVVLGERPEGSPHDDGEKLPVPMPGPRGDRDRGGDR